MITKGKLTIFDSFGGNEDSLARVGRNFEKRQFENNEWQMINSLYQDIELINKNLRILFSLKLPEVWRM